MARNRNRLALGLCFALIAGTNSGQALAQISGNSPCQITDVECHETLRGIFLSTSAETAALAATFPRDDTGNPIPGSKFEYVAVISCPQNSPSQPRLEICMIAATVCQRMLPPQPGPLAWVFRREVAEDGTIGPWNTMGTTCFAASVPPESGSAPVLTDAMIVEQFYEMEFAEPTIVMQPPGNQTLVTLPVYFEIVWPTEGFEPQEVDETTLAGRQVRIRPVLEHATYTFGDGTSEGPTPSLGGPYPDGDVTHSYDQAGSVNPSVSVTYSGEVSVDGADWAAIDASVTIDGPAEPLEVRTSRNRLYAND